MRHKNLLLIFYLLSSILYPLSSILAIPTIEFQHNSTQPGETILAKISTPGEFTKQIEKSQIKFFQGRKQTTLETDILYYNSTHYLYIYTTLETNLTLQIENILYEEADTLQSTTITKNLTIQTNFLTNEKTNETYTQILKIKPGFIFTSGTPKLKLTNVGTSQLNLTFNEEEISIPSLATHELEFSPEETFSLAKISTYKDFLIPTIYLTATKNTTFVSPLTKADLRQNPELLLAEIFTETKSQETIELFNFGNDNLTNLEATSSLDFIKIEDLQDMLGRGIQNLTLELKSKNPGHFQGTINISYTQNETQNTLQIPLSIFVLPKGTPVENFQLAEETCDQISGQVCSPGTLCNETATFTKNAEYCCLGSCVEVEKEDSESNGLGWLVAIVIFMVLGYTGYYFYKKQKQIQAPKAKDALKATTEKFEKRLAGTSETKRTTGNIAKS